MGTSDTLGNSGLVTVHLYGDLARKFGPKFRLAVNSISEALRLLEANFPGKFYKRVQHGEYYITAGGKEWDDGMSLNKDQIHLQLGGRDLHMVPTVHGASSKGGIFEIIVGAVLIGAAFVFSGGAAAALAGTAIPSFGALWGTVASVGAALAVGGIVQLISPQATTNLGTAPAGATTPGNSLFSGPVNSENQGVCVPLIYGRVIAGSVVASAAIHSRSVGTSTSGIGSGGTGEGRSLFSIDERLPDGTTV